MNAHDLSELLSGWRLRVYPEKTLQEDIESVLRESGISFNREFPLSKRDRVDFLVGSVAIEVKIKGSKTDVLRQLFRYAEHDRIREILLITTKAAHRSIDGEKLLGKDVSVYWINGL